MTRSIGKSGPSSSRILPWEAVSQAQGCVPEALLGEEAVAFWPPIVRTFIQLVAMSVVAALEQLWPQILGHLNDKLNPPAPTPPAPTATREPEQPVVPPTP